MKAAKASPELMEYINHVNKDKYSSYLDLCKLIKTVNAQTLSVETLKKKENPSGKQKGHVL